MQRQLNLKPPRRNFSICLQLYIVMLHFCSRSSSVHCKSSWSTARRWCWRGLAWRLWNRKLLERCRARRNLNGRPKGWSHQYPGEWPLIPRSRPFLILLFLLLLAPLNDYLWQGERLLLFFSGLQSINASYWSMHWWRMQGKDCMFLRIFWSDQCM